MAVTNKNVRDDDDKEDNLIFFKTNFYFDLITITFLQKKNKIKLILLSHDKIGFLYVSYSESFRLI